MKLNLLSIPFALTAACLHAKEPGQPKELRFSIAKASNPGGTAHYSGEVVFSRAKTTDCFQVKWKLSDGSTQSGFGVPFPQSGVIAVGYGPDLEGVAIYKKDGGKGEARWSIAKPESEIGSYDLTRGRMPGVFNIAGGGTVTLTAGADETGTVTFDLASGTYSGLVIGQGDYLALASGGKRIGVCIYRQSASGAEGRWTMAGAQGAGVENLTILEVDGRKVADGGPGEAPTGSEEAEVRAIAGAVRGNREELLKLRPTRAQLEEITATAEDTRLLETYVNGLFEKLPEGGIVPPQTECPN